MTAHAASLPHPAAPAGHSLAERHPRLADLARLALFCGLIWSMAALWLTATGALPLWVLLSIPAGTIALIAYVRAIHRCPLCVARCPLLADEAE